MADITEQEPLCLYTDKKTHTIYDVKFFDGFVLIRPVAPGFERHVKKIPMNLFAEHFEEFMGDYARIRELLSGEDSFIIR